MTLAVPLDGDEDAPQLPVSRVRGHDHDRPVERLHEIERDVTCRRRAGGRTPSTDDERERVARGDLGTQHGGHVTLPQVQRDPRRVRDRDGPASEAGFLDVHALDLRPEQRCESPRDLEHRARDH
jgi:hypothetical protein